MHEIVNVLRSGFIVIDDVSRRVWKSEKFAVGDLCAHIEGETIISDLMAAMESIEKGLFLDDKQLIFSTYVLDLLKLKTISEAKYPAAAIAE